MARSNIKLLTKDERKFFNDNYIFDLKDDVIIVKVKKFGRIVAHSINENFSINSTIRKITITTEAIDLWIKNFIKTKHSLIDVQNAVNALKISYQTLEYDDVKNQLDVIDKNDEKIF